MNLEEAARKFLVDEELYPELDVPIETVKEVMFAFLAHESERQMRKEAEKSNPAIAKHLVVSLSYLDESLQAQETGVPIGRVDQ
jgi:hypothetical protein